MAQKQFRAFIREGMNGETPWEELRGQILLGADGFFERFKDLLGDKERVKGIPRQQRYIGRPSLGKIFGGQKGKEKRNNDIHTTHLTHGYTLKEIADYLGVHYLTASEVIVKAGMSRD